MTDPKPYVPGADGELFTAARWNTMQVEARKEIAALREDLAALKAGMSRMSAGNYGFPTGILRPVRYFDWEKVGDAPERGFEWGSAKLHYALSIPEGVGCFVGLLTLSGNPNTGGSESYRTASTHLISMGGGYDDAIYHQVWRCIRNLAHTPLHTHGGAPGSMGRTELVSLHWGHETTGPAIAPEPAAAFSVVASQTLVHRLISDGSYRTDHHLGLSLHILHATA